MNELVTVIVPVYNVDRFLIRCLMSIQNQDYPLIEVILIDDGSVDESPTICDQFVAQDKRFSVIHKENEGVSFARNRGIELCHGDYCCFIDADDYLEVNYISRMLQELKKNDSDLVCCGCWRESLNGSIVWERKINKTTKFDRKHSLLELFTPTSFVGWPWNKMYKTSIIKKNGISFRTDLRYCEDEVFVLQYILHSNGVCYINNQLYHYIENQMSVNLKVYTEKKFDIRCLDRQKADDIYWELTRDLNDQELDSTLLARRFTSNIATMSKLLAGYRGEKDILYYLRDNLRSYYKKYLFNKRFHKRFLTEMKYWIVMLNPLIFLRVSKWIGKEL